MTADEKSRIHIAVLQALRAIGATGLSESGLANSARLAGFTLTVPELAVELRTLGDQNLIAAFTPLGGRRWRITALGESQLAEAGL